MSNGFSPNVVNLNNERITTNYNKFIIYMIGSGRIPNFNIHRHMPSEDILSRMGSSFDLDKYNILAIFRSFPYLAPNSKHLVTYEIENCSLAYHEDINHLMGSYSSECIRLEPASSTYPIKIRDIMRHYPAIIDNVLWIYYYCTDKNKVYVRNRQRDKITPLFVYRRNAEDYSGNDVEDNSFNSDTFGSFNTIAPQRRTQRISPEYSGNELRSVNISTSHFRGEILGERSDCIMCDDIVDAIAFCNKTVKQKCKPINELDYLANEFKNLEI